MAVAVYLAEKSVKTWRMFSLFLCLWSPPLGEHNNYLLRTIYGTVNSWWEPHGASALSSSPLILKESPCMDGFRQWVWPFGGFYNFLWIKFILWYVHTFTQFILIIPHPPLWSSPSPPTHCLHSRSSVFFVTWSYIAAWDQGVETLHWGLVNSPVGIELKKKKISSPWVPPGANSFRKEGVVPCEFLHHSELWAWFVYL